MTRGWRTLLSVTLAAVVMIAVGVSYIGGSYADSRAEEVLDQLLGNLPAGYHVTYESAESSIATDEVIVTGLVVRVDFAELIAAYGEEIETMAGDDGAAEDDAGAEEDASAEEDTGAADDAGAEDLDELEDLELTLTVERWAIADFDKENNPPRFMTQERLRYHADEATGEVDIPYYDLVLENIGAFEFAAKFGGYHIWPKSDAPFAAVANMETLTLHHLSFSFADAEFFDRAVEITAKRSGLTVKEIKEQTALMIALMAAETPDKRLQVAAAALVAFVHEPGRLTLHLAPERPINLMVWSALAETNPTAALNEINFSVTKD
jgi:hypothetical protein